MYATYVKNSAKLIANGKEALLTPPQMAQGVIGVINKAIHFYIQDSFNISDLLPFNTDKEVHKSFEDSKLSLPFSDITVSYFDIISKEELTNYASGIPSSDLEGLKNLKDNRKVYNCIVANVIKHDLIGISTWASYSEDTDDLRALEGSWESKGSLSLLSLYKSFKERDDLEDLSNKGFFQGETLKYVQGLDDEIYIQPIPGIDSDDMFNAICNSAESTIRNYLIPFLYLLNTKGIHIETVHPSGKVNKKRREKGRPELIEYRRLTVNIPKYEKDSDSDPTGIKKKFHLCRGHVRHYSSEHPLFGRFSGPVWIKDHCRGSLEKGIIDKDYDVKIL